MPIQTSALSYWPAGDANKQIVTDGAAFERMLHQLRSSPVITMDYETSGLDWHANSQSCGIALATVDRSDSKVWNWYVPYRHQTGEKQLDLNIIAPGIKGLLEDPTIMKVAHNIKFEDHFSRKEGWRILGPRYDTMIAGHLYDENMPLKLETRAEKVLGRTDARRWELAMKQEVLRLARTQKMGIRKYKEKYGYAQTPINLCGTYACFDTDHETELYLFYERWGVRSRYERIWSTEMDLTEVLCDMEEHGLPVDVEYLELLRTSLGGVKAGIVDQIQHVLGPDMFNLGSDYELRTFLLSKLRLPLFKKTKGKQLSVDREVLEFFGSKSPVLKLILKWRDADKLENTYTTSILKRMDKNGVVHPNFQQCGTNCMPAGELVLTDRGYLPVEQVQVGDQVITHKGRARKVLQTIDNGVQPVWKVTLANGLCLNTTGNHGYRVGNAWVAAKNLEVGMPVTVHSHPEVWKTIDGWAKYGVSSWGRVLNHETSRLLKLRVKDSCGHLSVTLSKDGSRRKDGNKKDFLVHRLVLAHFSIRDHRSNGVRHLSGYGWENVLQNLKWGTPLENSRDACLHGSVSRRDGDKAKLSEEIVQLIRRTPYIRGNKRLGVLGSDERLANQFGVCRQLVCKVRLGKVWAQKEVEGKRSKFFQSKVVSVERLRDSVPTFGLTVAEDASHVTGGIVTHNTGRLSCKDPNFQNQPTDDDDRAKEYSGKSLEDGGIDPWSIRRAFIVRRSPSGKPLPRLIFDYSQVELRGIAYYSGDETMHDVYRVGGDIHAAVSREIGCPRRTAKTINFGLSYCLTAMGLSRQTGLTVDEAEAFMTRFEARFPGIPKLRERLWRSVRMDPNASFTNIFGRTRRIPLINSMEDWERGRAERQAIGSLIQGTASELTKESLVRVSKFLKEEKLPAFLVNTVHDELQIDSAVDCMVTVAKGVKRLMENYPEFSPIPIIADGSYTVTSWAEKHALPTS